MLQGLNCLCGLLGVPYSKTLWLWKKVVKALKEMIAEIKRIKLLFNSFCSALDMITGAGKQMLPPVSQHLQHVQNIQISSEMNDISCWYNIMVNFH